MNIPNNVLNDDDYKKAFKSLGDIRNNRIVDNYVNEYADNNKLYRWIHYIPNSFILVVVVLIIVVIYASEKAFAVNNAVYISLSIFIILVPVSWYCIKKYNDKIYDKLKTESAYDIYKRQIKSVMA